MTLRATRFKPKTTPTPGRHEWMDSTSHMWMEHKCYLYGKMDDASNLGKMCISRLESARPTWAVWSLGHRQAQTS